MREVGHQDAAREAGYSLYKQWTGRPTTKSVAWWALHAAFSAKSPGA